jgi:hypothetical protein
MISFIHIGKTGGTTINNLLAKMKNYKQYHHNKDYNNNEKYIIWLRNPISRFVSAFNHSYYSVRVDVKSIKTFDLKHCLLPMRLKNSIDKPYVFSSKYDTLIKEFTSANHLAESLTSNDVIIKNKAIDLMNSSEEHLYKGIGWYLSNGKFVENRHENILFVGKIESMTEDIKNLSKKLNIEMNENLKLRENVYIDKSMKYLSPLAIKNLIEWYNNTDYAALKQLLKYGFITEELFSSYNTYTYS